MPQTPTKQYKVQGPDGAEHVIEGPDGATDDEVIAQAKQLFGQPTPAAHSDDRTATEVAQDQAANVLKGIPQAITGIPSLVMGAGKAALDTLSGKDTDFGQNLIKSAVAPVAVPLRGAGALIAPGSVTPPTKEAWEGAAQGAGALLGGAALGGATELAGGALARNFVGSEGLHELYRGSGLGPTIAAIPNMPNSSPVERAMNERQINAFASQIKSGVGEESVHQVAQTAIPIFQKAASELGTNLEQSAGAKFPTRGITESGKQAVRTAGEHAIDIADHAVDIADRPFKDVLNQHGDVSTNRAQFGAVKTPQVQSAILDKLESLAKENDKVNQPLADAIRATAERVQATGGTFSGLNDLKVLANKKSSALFDKSLGAQLNASADVAYAWKAMGDTIRSEMYPELSRISGTDLRQAGATEAAVMDARDGIRKTYYKDVLPAHAQFMANTYFERLVNGSLYHHNLIRRALGLTPTPAGEFNLLFKRGLGEVPPTPGQVPIYPGANPNTPPTVSGAQLDLLPTGAPGTEPLLAPPPGTANTRNTPSGSTMAEDIFRVQQRANREARMAPPPTIAGEQAGGLFTHDENVPAPIHYIVDEKGNIVGQHNTEAPIRTLFSDQYGAEGTHQTALEEYQQQLHQRQIWKAGAETKPKGQLGLESKAPPDLFGIRQHLAEAVPEGTRLEFTTTPKGGGQTQYHYVTPSGRRFTTEFEVSPDVLKTKPNAPYEPGTHVQGAFGGQSNLFLNPPPGSR